MNAIIGYANLATRHVNDTEKLSRYLEKIQVCGEELLSLLNGYDATLTIREMKDPKKAGIPIIAMTANAFAEDANKALSVGMNDHVAKPIDMSILVPTMMKYHDTRSGATFLTR